MRTYFIFFSLSGLLDLKTDVARADVLYTLSHPRRRILLTTLLMVLLVLLTRLVLLLALRRGRRGPDSFWLRMRTITPP